MKLINYLIEGFENYKIEHLKDDLYYINNVTLKDVERINKLPDYQIVDFSIISKKYYSMENIIKNINPIIITKRGIINLNQLQKNYVDKKQSGLVILKKIYLPKKEIIKDYNTIEDLDKDNLCLMFKGKFICLYDRELIIQDGDINLNGVLFMTTFNDYDKNPYDATMIIGMASNVNFSGSQLAYPIVATLTNQDGFLYPYRYGTSPSNLSPGARTAWYNFFIKKGPLKPYAPIDDIDNPITKSKMDDGEVYNPIERELMDDWNSKKQKVLNFKGQKFYLIKYKKGDFTDWIYQVKTDIKSKILSISKKLISNHSIFKKENKEIESLILMNANQFFRHATDKRS